MTKNQWNDDTKEYERIPLPEQSEEEEEEDDEAAFTAPKTIFELPVGVRVAYILMYGTEPDTVDLEHL